MPEKNLEELRKETDESLKKLLKQLTEYNLLIWQMVNAIKSDLEEVNKILNEKK